MLTPRGLYELKYFFSSHVGTTSGGEASSTAIRAKIKKMEKHYSMPDIEDADFEELPPDDDSKT
jgi:DNA-directed RNA polymerase specialized sigma54-like protein